MNYYITSMRRKGRWSSRTSHPKFPLVIARSQAQAAGIARQLLGIVERPQPPRAA
jgi:hypothetical protein